MVLSVALAELSVIIFVGLNRTLHHLWPTTRNIIHMQKTRS